MTLGNQILDKNLLRQVVQKLARCGTGSQSHVTSAVSGGNVTLTGTLRYEHERRFILRSMSSISGIRRVIDQLRVVPKASRT